ncbi:MAG: hypothetical protein JJU11_18520 [Candidatus Sumerlaeia bacterium]|nr:hypothetical protein [Candidatus Sumerlaeia bacterium]
MKHWDHQALYEALKARGLEQIDEKRGSGRLLEEPYVYLWDGQDVDDNVAVLYRHDSRSYLPSPIHIHAMKVPKYHPIYKQMKPLIVKARAKLDPRNFMYYSVPAENWSKIAEILGLVEDEGSIGLELADSSGIDTPSTEPAQHALAAPEESFDVILPPVLQVHFSPERSDPTTATRVASTVEVRQDHGVVTNALEELLRLSVEITGNDKRQDLIIVEDGKVRVLFELKSNATTQSIYTCIGQLMYYGALQDEPPLRVAVLPEDVSAEARVILGRLGIRLVTFRLADDRPEFRGLKKILGEYGIVS